MDKYHQSNPPTELKSVVLGRKNSRKGTSSTTPCLAIPEWAATEIRETWNAARKAGGELQAFRIIERMVDRLGYGRTENNPPLLPNTKS